MVTPNVDLAPFNVLSLCSGYGGIELGLSLAVPRARPVCYVEREAHAAAVLVARMEEECLHPAPVWTDLGTFDGRPFAGLVDCVAAGIPCFVAGTAILTRRGYLPIEEVVVGDQVLTHRGRWRRVSSVMQREDAPLVSVQAGGVPWTITTPEHPFWARSYNPSHGDQRRTWGDSSWTNAAELAGQFVAQVLPPVRRNNQSPDFWWVVGRYLADGWLCERKNRRIGRVAICCAHKEAEGLEKRLRQAGFRPTPSYEPTSTKFYINNKELFVFLEQFGRYAHGKRLPGIALELDSVRAEALLSGMLSGDGHLDKRGDRVLGQRLTTVSRGLALGAALLAQRARGVVAGVRRCRMPPRTRIEGREVNQRDFYVVHIPTRNRSAFVEGNYGWKLCRRVEERGRGRVFNISVEEDESYVADGAIVHNCQPHSQAGKRRHTKDERWLWPHVVRILDECEAPLLFIENVDGFKEVLPILDRDLGHRGYRAVAGRFSAEEVGAPHRRIRWFILAHHDVGQQVLRSLGLQHGEPKRRDDAVGCGGSVGAPRAVADHDDPAERVQSGRSGRTRGEEKTQPGVPRQGLADTADHGRREGRGNVSSPKRSHDADARRRPGDSPDQGRAWAESPSGENSVLGVAWSDPGDLFPPRRDRSLWADIPPDLQPPFPRLDDGTPALVDHRYTSFRLRLSGSGVVPLVAAYAFRALALAVIEKGDK